MIRVATTAAAKTEIGQPHDLALAHRNAADDLREIFAGADAHQEFLGFAEAAHLRHALRIGGKLAQRLDIGREPGKAMGRPLFAVEDARNRAPLDRHTLADGAAGIGEELLDGRNRVIEGGDDIVARGKLGGGKRHDWLRDDWLR